MANRIILNEEEIEEHAEDITLASKAFEEKKLTQPVKASTIVAYGNSQEEFKKAQDNITLFGTALAQDADNIRSLNVEFKEFDEMIGELNKTQ